MAKDLQDNKKGSESPFNWPRTNDRIEGGSGTPEDENVRQRASKYPEPDISDVDIPEQEQGNKSAYPGQYTLRGKVATPPNHRKRLMRFLRRPKTVDIKNRYRYNRFV